MKQKDTMLSRMLSNQKGATAVEYGIAAATIALVIAVIILSVGKSLCGKFETVAHMLGSTAAGVCGGGSSGS